MDIKVSVPLDFEPLLTQLADLVAARLERRLAELQPKPVPPPKPAAPRRSSPAQGGRLSISDLEERLGVTRRTVSRWVATGAFPKHAYVGEFRKWWLHEVEAWEAANATAPANLGRRVEKLLRRKPAADRLGITELEQRLGVHRTTLAAWVRQGRFPKHHYVGESRKWWLHEVEAWEAATTAESPGTERRHRALGLAQREPGRDAEAVPKLCPTSPETRPGPDRGG